MSNSQEISPIEWPSWYQCGQRQFLEGFPIIGPHARIVREAKSMLKERDARSVEQLWEQYEQVVPVTKHRLLVLGIAADYLGWPNLRFAPDDLSPIVLGCIPGISIDATDIVDDVLKKLDAKTTASAELLESVVESRLVDFFRCLDKHIV